MGRHLVRVLSGEREYAVCEDINQKRLILPVPLTEVRCGDVLEIISATEIRKLHDGSKETACLFVTNHCNSNCIMCPDSEKARAEDQHIQVEFLEDYIKLLPTDLPHLDVTGGEPTLIKYELPKLLELAFSHFESTSVMLLSNGRAFADQRYAEAFAKFGKRELVVEIPIHGYNAETHDLISKAAGSFAQTMAGIKNLLHFGCKIGIRIVVSKLNVTCLEQICALICSEYPEAGFINFMGLEMLGSAGLNRDKVWVEFEAAAPIMERCADVCFHYGMEPRFYNFPLCLFEKRYWALYRKSISPHKVYYPEFCEKCEIQEHCGGFFRSTAYISQFQGKRGRM